MTLTKKGEYGLRTMIQLGLGKALGRDLLSVTELAESNRLPLKFIERILFELREAGFVDTERGKFGGYRLAMPAEKISMGAVVRLLDGRLAPIACASETEYARCTCPEEEHCGLRMLMIDVRNAISNILDRYSLGDVVEVTLRKMKQDKVVMPFSQQKADRFRRGRRVADPASGFLSALGIKTHFDASTPTADGNGETERKTGEKAPR